jgi:cation:H+ antiporter
MTSAVMCVQVIGGLIVLLAGGDLLVRGSVSLARRLAVSPLLIGLTVVAAGTSAPELVVSLDAALKGSPALAIGNVVGSNVANILLVLGLAALLRPVTCDVRTANLDNIAMMVSSVVFAAFCLGGAIESWQGLVLLVFLLGYLSWRYWHGRANATERQHYADEVAEFEGKQRPLWRSVLYVLAGLAGLMIGGDVLIEGAVDLARAASISEAVIGLTLIAVGTSLPELVAVIFAVLHGHGDLAIGNVIGSNIFNILGVVGATAVVIPLAVPPEVLNVDLWIMLATALLLTPFLIRRKPIRAPVGAGFVVAYAVFVVAQFYLSHHVG